MPTTKQQPKISRTDAVKIAYVEFVQARMQFRVMAQVFKSLPKKLYRTRKSHKNQDWVAKKTGKPRQSKYNQFFIKYLNAQQRFTQKEEQFSMLVKGLTKDEKFALTHGVDMPYNVLAQEVGSPKQ